MEQLLLIDDDVYILEFISKFLSEFGYDVKTAHDGKEGIELLKNGARYKAIITDICMPNKDGNDVARYVKNEVSLSKTPIVAITGFVHDAKKELFDCVLEKPFKIAELVDVVESMKS